MFTLRTLSFDLRDASQKLYLLKLRTDYLKRSFSYSGGYLIAEVIFLRISGLQNLYATSKELINGSLYRTQSHTANM